MSVFSTMCVQYHLNIYVAAARTYYRTKSQEKSLKERGKFEERGQARRRRERLSRVRLLESIVCMSACYM